MRVSPGAEGECRPGVNLRTFRGVARLLLGVGVPGKLGLCSAVFLTIYNRESFTVKTIEVCRASLGRAGLDPESGAAGPGPGAAQVQVGSPVEVSGGVSQQGVRVLSGGSPTHSP